MKQNAVFIGNCQCSGILKLLEYTTFFSKYNVKQYANWQMIKNKSAPPIQDLKNADLVVYQPLPDEYGCYSTNKNNEDSMFCEVSDSTRLMGFPRIHNNSLWPLLHKTAHKNSFYGDNFFQYYVNQNITTKEKFLYLYDNMLMDFKLQERYIKNIEISRQKEHDTEIKIIDYIEKSLVNKRLFLTQDHPTTTVFYNCVEQMVNLLDLSFIANFDYESIDENITKLEDSTYGIPSMKYPDSTYSICNFNYAWQATVDDTFYRNIFIDYLQKMNIK